MPVKQAPPPVKHRVCDSCGSTTYPQPQPVPGQAWVVAWVVPTVCAGCGGQLPA